MCRVASIACALTSAKGGGDGPSRFSAPRITNLEKEFDVPDSHGQFCLRDTDGAFDGDNDRRG